MRLCRVLLPDVRGFAELFDKLSFIITDIGGRITDGVEDKLAYYGSPYEVNTANIYEFRRIIAVIGTFIGIDRVNFIAVFVLGVFAMAVVELRAALGAEQQSRQRVRLVPPFRYAPYCFAAFLRRFPC